MDRFGQQRKTSFYLRLRALLRTTRDRLRSLPARLKNARQAFMLNTPPSRLEIKRFEGFQVAYRSGTADEKVLRDSFSRDLFFNRVPEYQPQPDDVILDVGAHLGTFSLLAATKVPQGKVFAIEACAETARLTQINVDLNALENVEVCQLALADQRGQTRLYYDTSGGNWGHSISKPLSGYSEEVSTDSLTNFLDDRGIERCDFLKMNCEGAEFKILLATCPSVLSRFGQMVVLYHCDLVLDFTADDLRAHLHAAGFHTEVRRGGNIRGWIVATNTAPQWIARHSCRTLAA